MQKFIKCHELLQCKSSSHYFSKNCFKDINSDKFYLSFTNDIVSLEQQDPEVSRFEISLNYIVSIPPTQLVIRTWLSLGLSDREKFCNKSGFQAVVLSQF